MEDKFHELALEKLTGRASAEESRKLGEYLGQDPALQAEYERLKLEVQAAKDLIPLIKETDSDSEDLPEYEKNMLMAEVRSVFSPDNQESEPAHEADPQQEEPFWKYWKWAGGLTATALLAFIILTPNPEVTEDEPKYTKKSMDDTIQAADTLKSQYEDLRQDLSFDSSLEGFKTGEGNGLLTAIASIEMHDQLVDFEIEEYVSLAKSNTDSDFRAWLEKQKKLQRRKNELEEAMQTTFNSYHVAYKLASAGDQENQWTKILADSIQAADTLKGQYEDLRQDLSFDSSLEGFKTGEGNGLLTAIASIEMHDQLVDFEIEEYVSLAKSNTDSDFRAWLEKQKKRRGELGKSKKEQERELTEVIKSYIKNNVTNARGKRWRENLADCEKKADRLKSQYEDLRQLLARSR